MRYTGDSQGKVEESNICDSSLMPEEISCNSMTQEMIGWKYLLVRFRAD